mgnify:CR=1 FL=1
MKAIKFLMVSLVVVFVVSLIPGQVLLAQQQSQSEQEQKMMKLWMENATPGENHKYFEYFTGDWEVTATMWMAPGAAPEVAKGDCKSEIILGGRFLKSYSTGSMMGMPYEGLSITAYDNFKKEFVTIWIDNAGTGIYQTSGTLDKATKTRTETGLWDDIMTGGKFKVRLTVKVIDDGKYIFEMYSTNPEGKEFKSGEIVYIRKK